MKKNELVSVHLKSGKKIKIMAGEVLGLERIGKLDTKKSAVIIKEVKADEDLVKKAKAKSDADLKNETKQKQRDADKESKKDTKRRNIVEVMIKGKKKRVTQSEAEMLTRLGKIDGKKESEAEIEAREKLEEALLEAEMLIEDNEIEKAEEILKDIDPNKLPEKLSNMLKERKESNKTKERKQKPQTKKAEPKIIGKDNLK